MALAALSTLLVFAPLALRFAGQWMPWLVEIVSAWDNWRIWMALALIVIGLIITHLFLPAGRRHLIDVLPGIVVTILAWVAGALIFAYYLTEFANYAATYAGLASIMIALVFLYMIGGDLHHRRRDQRGAAEIPRSPDDHPGRLAAASLTPQRPSSARMSEGVRPSARKAASEVDCRLLESLRPSGPRTSR